MTEPGRKRHVLVTLDTGDSWNDILLNAARLARVLSAELHTLLLEDEDLHTIAELPFTVEISLYPARRRKWSPEDLQRSQRQRLKQVQMLVERVLSESGLSGHIERATRAGMLEQLRRAGGIVWVHRRSGLARWPRYFQPNHDTLYLVYSGSAASEALMPIAQLLLRSDYRHLQILNLSSADAALLSDRFLSLHKTVECQPLPTGIELDTLLAMVDNRFDSTLLIAAEPPLVSDTSELLRRLSSLRLEALVAL